MAEFKATKAAFVGSLISLLLSCAMLVGTTFAWFTDSVSSADNRIIAGNLDIDLLLYKPVAGEYVSIAKGSGDIFAEANGGKNVIWEPGETEIVYLAVENIGTLALKYDIRLDIDDKGLAGALEYAILDGVNAKETTKTNWNEIQSSQKGKVQAKTSIPIANGELNKQDDKNYFAIAVHMPDNTIDTYQGKSIIVDLTVMATQSVYEEDSFGKEYDKGASYEESKQSKSADAMTVVTIDRVEDFKKFTEAVTANAKYDGVRIANNPEVYVKLTENIDLSDYADFAGVGDGEDNAFDGVFDGCNHTIKNWTADNLDKPSALFCTTKSADIKNLTIENFKVGADTTKGTTSSILIGLIEGDAVAIDKVSIKNAELTGKETIGVVVGTMTEGYLTITNCNVEDITIKNAEGYTDKVGVLLGNGYSEKDYEESGFKESENTIANIKWLCGDAEQTTVPAYNYKK